MSTGQTWPVCSLTTDIQRKWEANTSETFLIWCWLFPTKGHKRPVSYLAKLYVRAAMTPTIGKRNPSLHSLQRPYNRGGLEEFGIGSYCTSEGKPDTFSKVPIILHSTFPMWSLQAYPTTALLIIISSSIRICKQNQQPLTLLKGPKSLPFS